ncbi:hypothetical protein JXQ31_11795 [candidate division KSB1 bacterium]|nr:hypothetical protein [candidate division KSB1 bacterium]
MFKWSCGLKDKGKACIRGYNYIGRLCDGCTHYTDEKIHYQPRINVSAAEFENFKAELDDFEDWFAQVQNSDVLIWAEIDSIKPRFKKYIQGKKGQIRLEGYILIFKNGYIDQTPFEDYFYAYISANQQDRLRLAPGDRFEAKGRLKMNHGRLLTPKLWHIDFEHRSGNETWNNSKTLVARQTATHFNFQSENCLHCPHGALVDVFVKDNGSVDMYRELYCLAGIKDQSLCYVHAFKQLDLNKK